MLPPKQFHPFRLDTFGLGSVLRAAAKRGARRCLVGIGGSATNDGGFGVACALGWKFLNREGKRIDPPADVTAYDYYRCQSCGQLWMVKASPSSETINSR